MENFSVLERNKKGSSNEEFLLSHLAAAEK